MAKKHKERDFVFTSTKKDSTEAVTITATSLGKAWRKLRRKKGNHVGKKDYIVSEDFF